VVYAGPCHGCGAYIWVTGPVLLCARCRR
jgi:hypothetical protein